MNKQAHFGQAHCAPLDMKKKKKRELAARLQSSNPLPALRCADVSHAASKGLHGPNPT